MSTLKTKRITTAAVLQPMYSIGALTLGEDQFAGIENVNINLDGTQAFSFGGWLRLLAAEGEDNILLSVATANTNNGLCTVLSTAGIC